MLVKFNKEHFACCFKMFFNYGSYLPWSFFCTRFEPKHLIGHELDLSGNALHGLVLKFYFSDLMDFESFIFEIHTQLRMQRIMF